MLWEVSQKDCYCRVPGQSLCCHLLGGGIVIANLLHCPKDQELYLNRPQAFSSTLQALHTSSIDWAKSACQLVLKLMPSIVCSTFGMHLLIAMSSRELDNVDMSGDSRLLHENTVIDMYSAIASQQCMLRGTCCARTCIDVQHVLCQPAFGISSVHHVFGLDLHDSHSCTLQGGPAV